MIKLQSQKILQRPRWSKVRALFKSMGCVAEAMGMSMSLTGSATIPATHADRLFAAQLSGRRIVDLVLKGTTARRIINQMGIEKEILPLLHGEAFTVSGKTVAENLVDIPAGDPAIIRSCGNPWNSRGGLAVLHGNLAPDTAVTKPAAIHADMQTFASTARCFSSEEEANQAILNGEIRAGEVLVIRYEGPKGGPGMREMATAMKLLYGSGLAMKTAVITDGRFSGTNNGCFVGHISPEAAEGGPISAVRDGDIITIDIPNWSIQLKIKDHELQARLSKWQRPPARITKGFLSIYAKLAASAAEGAILKTD